MTSAPAVAIVSLAQRRRQLQQVLDPHMARFRHLDFAVDQAIRYGWNVERAVDDNDIRANRATRTIYMTPVVSDNDVAMLFHEGGHLEDREVRRWIHAAGRRVSITGEIEAWRFAMRTLGWRWTLPMHDGLTQSLWSYRKDGYIQEPSERVAFDDLIEASRELARHVVHVLPEFRKAAR